MQRILCGVAALGTLTLAGCVGIEHDHAPARHETRSIPLDKAEMVRAEIKIGAGNLNIRGGSSQLVDTDFTYSDESLKPEIRYDSSGFRGRLSIDQRGNGHGGFGDGKYDWNIRFNDDVPLSMMLHFGAGNADLNLGSLNLDNLEINMGVGNLKLDLKGNPKKDYSVSIHGGVGNATVYLPENVGVIADAHGGIGSINAGRLRKQGSGRYVNQASEEHAKITVRLDIRGGIGTVELVGG